MTDDGARDRAEAALYGLAIGDALGMPTQLMSSEQVRARYGRLTWFHPAAPDHPIAAGMPAGSVTDDTEQALLLARLLIEGDGHVDPRRWASELVTWEDSMRARGSLDLLGPSTRAAVTAVQDGVPAGEAGWTGTTNGAAMRVAPVGLVLGSDDLVALVDRVEEVSLVSHHTGVAIAAAAAAALGEGRGHWVAGASVARRIDWARTLADPADPDRGLHELVALVGTSLASTESVPTAFGVLATFPDDPWAAVLAAASLGGDSDTIAAMVGAMAGAARGLDAFPDAARERVAAVNRLDLAPVAAALLRLR